MHNFLHWIVPAILMAFALGPFFAMAFQSVGNTPARGAQNHSGGVYDQSAQQDLVDADSFEGPITVLTGTTAGGNPDVINPHVAGNYIINSGAVDGITLGLPNPGGPSTLTAGIGGDDGLTINIWSATAFAHTVVLPSAKFASGQALHGTATFPAFAGAGMTLRAWNGTWQVVGNSTGPVVFSA